LINEVFPNEKEKATPHQRLRLSAEDIQKVVHHYENDNVSWQAPGKRDFKSYRVNGEKVQKQKRFMLMNISEAFELFKKEYPISIHKSKFYELRPPHVVPVKETPHNVCVCVKHANFLFLIEALSPFINLKKTTTSVFEAFLEIMCCKIDREECMKSDCKECRYDVKTVMNCDDYSMMTKLKQWEKKDTLQVYEQINTLEMVTKELNETLCNFKLHFFVKRRQSEYFEELKKNVRGDTAVLQMDFAENYSIILQDEIQSAHWQHSQVTIFTCCIWLKGEIKSYVVISDDLSHSKQSAWLFLKRIVTDLKWDHDIKTLHIFSDNCSSQFRSKYTVYNLYHLADDLGVKSVEWNTFAAGHGKGAVDAIGGLTKRIVWNAVKSRRILVGDATSFFNFLQKETNKINALYVSLAEVEETSNFLNARWAFAKELKGIRNYHHFKKRNKNFVYAAITSKSALKSVRMRSVEPKLRYEDVYSDSEDEDSLPPVEHFPQYSNYEVKDIKPNCWVLVKIESEGRRSIPFRYVGICQSEVDEEGEILVMFAKKCGNNMKFTINEKDEKFIKKEQVLTVLGQPDMKIIGNRVYYVFNCPVNVLEKV